MYMLLYIHICVCVCVNIYTYDKYIYISFFQIVFLKAYLEGDPKFAADPEGVINGLLKEIAVFVLASDFMWGLWSLVQSSMSGIAFGYLVSGVHNL